MMVGNEGRWGRGVGCLYTSPSVCSHTWSQRKKPTRTALACDAMASGGNMVRAVCEKWESSVCKMLEKSVCEIWEKSVCKILEKSVCEILEKSVCV